MLAAEIIEAGTVPRVQRRACVCRRAQARRDAEKRWHPARSRGGTKEAFGETLSQTGTDGNPYQFAGERLVDSVGMYQNRDRWLDTRTGRFVSVDPAEGDAKTPLTMQPFAYVANSPANLVDPTGLTAKIYVLAFQDPGNAVVPFAGERGVLEDAIAAAKTKFGDSKVMSWIDQKNGMWAGELEMEQAANDDEAQGIYITAHGGNGTIGIGDKSVCPFGYTADAFYWANCDRISCQDAVLRVGGPLGRPKKCDFPAKSSRQTRPKILVMSACGAGRAEGAWRRAFGNPDYFFGSEELVSPGEAKQHAETFRDWVNEQGMFALPRLMRATPSSPYSVAVAVPQIIPGF